MSKLEDTLRKDGWKLTPGIELKTGDYIAVIGGYSNTTEGSVSHVVENDNGSSTVFYGDTGVEVFHDETRFVWLAPKEYEHLEVRWNKHGARYINISTDPRKPLFCLASYITVKHVFKPDNRNVALHSCKNPDALLKEKP